MSMLVAALALFALAHLVPVIPPAKSMALSMLGRAYGPVYGVLSLLLLVLVFVALRAAPTAYVYSPPAWGRHANFLLTLLAFFCFGIFAFRGSLRNRLKYPVAIGVTLWAIGHLLANGDARSIVFFAGFWGIAIVQVLLSLRLRAWKPSEVRAGHDGLSLLFGAAFYGVAVQLHSVFAGVPVIDISVFQS
ncbi:MAG: NnrU family protein [Proteobacteria bacterium]|nr:NnrU family protein [Pseudomonadota bacterium]